MTKRDKMNILSKNTFAVIISGILCSATIAPVLAQKQKRQPQTTVGSKTFHRQHGKRQYQFRQRLFRTAVSTPKSLRNTDLSAIEQNTFGDKENKSMSAMNIENESNKLAKPESNKQQSAYRTRSASKSENPNVVQKVTSKGTVLRISLRDENQPARNPIITTLPNGLKVNVLPLNTPQIKPGYSIPLSNGRTIKFLSPSNVPNKNVIDLTE